MIKNILCLFVFIASSLFVLTTSTAQEILLLETAGKVVPQKIFLGQTLNYKIKGEDIWRMDVLDEITAEENLVLLGRNYIKIDNIEKLRFERGWVKAAGTSLMIFGTAWSAFGIVGYATDGDPTTKYQASDAIFSASTIATGFLFKKLFKYRIVKQGKKHKLRTINLNF